VRRRKETRRTRDNVGMEVRGIPDRKPSGGGDGGSGGGGTKMAARASGEGRINLNPLSGPTVPFIN